MGRCPMIKTDNVQDWKRPALSSSNIPPQVIAKLQQEQDEPVEEQEQEEDCQPNETTTFLDE
jgi:hypothetical protein